ncbi:hypothetical protein FRUB_08033 [Fimbriiglobus ruber]|uniref:Uncharacterized protein n=1 Tax=Fimbriiglobus ruber TaxID=1908690 RepID=A0A225D1I9_9BACT|nr:hypothetical protein FRUB_08033 [Fimbriiglobus ruber]
MLIAAPQILLRFPTRRPRPSLRQFSIGCCSVCKSLGDEYCSAASFVRDQVQNSSAKAKPE